MKKHKREEIKTKEWLKKRGKTTSRQTKERKKESKMINSNMQIKHSDK